MKAKLDDLFFAVVTTMSGVAAFGLFVAIVIFAYGPFNGEQAPGADVQRISLVQALSTPYFPTPGLGVTDEPLFRALLFLFAGSILVGLIGAAVRVLLQRFAILRQKRLAASTVNEQIGAVTPAAELAQAVINHEAPVRAAERRVNGERRQAIDDRVTGRGTLPA